MSASPRTYDKVRFHRGTRGFAAFLTILNGFAVLGATLFVVPTLPLEPLVATWAVILGTTTPEAAGLLAIITENEGASLPTFFIFALGFVILTLPLGIYFTRLSRRLAVKR